MDSNTPPLPPPMQVGMSSSNAGLGFNPTPASMIPHHQYQQTSYMINSPSSSHTILPFGPTPTTSQSQQSFPSLISPVSHPFPSIHTSIPPTHFLSGSMPSQLTSVSSPSSYTLDKRRRNASSKRSLEEEEEDDNQIEIDDSGEHEEPTRAKPIELKLQQQTKFVDNNAKGCNCKKTGCLKRYCECFQNNKRCTIKCRCQGCKNYHECPDLHRVLEKQTKTGTGAQTTSNTTQRKTQRRKTNPVSQTAPQSSSSNNTITQQPRPPIGSPSILGGGIVMAHGSVSQFNPLTFTNPQIASTLHQNSLGCVYGEEKIVELCKKLVLAAIQQEQVFKDEWKQDNSAPKTPKSTRKEGNQQVDNFLLCDEDDMHHTTQPQSTSNRKVYPKGFENALTISLNERITSEFKHFLLSGVQTLKSQQATETQNILNNSMNGLQYQ